MALTANRKTLARTQSVLANFPVNGGSHIYAGALVALDVTGFLVPAAASANLTVIGRADEEKDNTGGQDADLYCRVQQGVYKWDNDSGSAVTQALAGTVCYVKDDHTVGLSESNSIVAGIVLELDDDGDSVWVQTMKASPVTAAITGYPSAGAIETVATGAVSVVKRTTLITIDGTKAYTLANGTIEGQRKSIRVTTAENTPNGTLTPTTFADGTSIDIDAAEEFVELEWHATGGWRIVLIVGATVNA